MREQLGAAFAGPGYFCLPATEFGSMTTSDPRTWMWNEALNMIARAEHLHRRFFEPVTTIKDAIWEPPVDIFENDLELWIVAALPGVEQSDLQVALEADALRVTGQRRLPAVTRAATLLRLEIPYGRFERSVALPRGSFVLGRSELVNGCLVICLKKHR
jgi:HSP20 family protein